MCRTDEKPPERKKRRYRRKPVKRAVWAPNGRSIASVLRAIKRTLRNMYPHCWKTTEVRVQRAILCAIIEDLGGLSKCAALGMYPNDLMAAAIPRLPYTFVPYANSFKPTQWARQTTPPILDLSTAC